MSNTRGEVWSLDGRILGHFEYNGTCDFANTRVYATVEDVGKNWRKDNQRDCTCDAAGERVILWTQYGGGFYWTSRVCWNCMAITGTKEPYDDSHCDGHPFPQSAITPSNNWLTGK